MSLPYTLGGRFRFWGTRLGAAYSLEKGAFTGAFEAVPCDMACLDILNPLASEADVGSGRDVETDSP